MKSVFVMLFSMITVAASVGSASEYAFQSWANLSKERGLYVQDYCAWAPREPGVCQARTACKSNPQGSVCARYCNVNPYDVVCGDSYRPHNPGSRQNDGNSPYPWARSRGGFCDQNPGHIACQHGVWWDRGY